MNIEIRLLKESDNRGDFSCDNYELDGFFQKFAGQNQFKHYIGTTYIALIGEKIVGFISVSASSVKTDDLSMLILKKLPNYPLPILRLTRMGIDTRYKSKGIGKALLKFTMNLTLEQKNKFGCIGLIVDAKEESVGFYSQFGFEQVLVKSGKLDVRPFAESMFLATSVIEKVNLK